MLLLRLSKVVAPGIGPGRISHDGPGVGRNGGSLHPPAVRNNRRMCRDHARIRADSRATLDLERARSPTIGRMVTADALSISDAADATGLSAHTLRYYERAGLMLDPVERAPSSHRRYTEHEIRWVTLLTRMRATGMPIRRIREYADLVRAGDGNEAERLALLEAHRDSVLEQLDAMRSNLAAVEFKIALYRSRLEGDDPRRRLLTGGAGASLRARRWRAPRTSAAASRGLAAGAVAACTSVRVRRSAHPSTRRCRAFTRGAGRAIAGRPRGRPVRVRGERRSIRAHATSACAPCAGSRRVRRSARRPADADRGDRRRDGRARHIRPAGIRRA